MHVDETLASRRSAHTIAVMEHGLRASDTDRERVIDALQRHVAAGRLNLDEFTERVDAALAARTHVELNAVTADLPTTVETPSTLMTDGARQLRLAFALAALTVAVLFVVLALTR
jgi:hypothetical protein